VRILHSADIHLAPRLEYIEDRGRRAQRREDFARQVDRLPELVREHGVDAVVLAGDVFDRDLPGQPEAARLAAALAACGVPVLITPGTHDSWRPGGVWDRPWPANVTVFSEDRWRTVVVGETAFHGLASLGRARPGGLFAGLPTLPEGARFAVGVAHASMLRADIKGKVDPKNLPFEEAELDGCGLHYLALGDHHRTRVVSRGPVTAAMEAKYAHIDELGRRYQNAHGRRYYLRGGKRLDDVWDMPAIAPESIIRPCVRACSIRVMFIA